MSGRRPIPKLFDSRRYGVIFRELFARAPNPYQGAAFSRATTPAL
jgi:hypothetical protein